MTIVVYMLENPDHPQTRDDGELFETFLWRVSVLQNQGDYDISILLKMCLDLHGVAKGKDTSTLLTERGRQSAAQVSISSDRIND